MTRLALPTFTKATLRKIMVTMLAFALLIGASVSLSPAKAQDAGMDRDLVINELRKIHAESTIGMGLASNGGVVELFTTMDGSTWTLILTMPDGKSRVIGGGESWMINARPIPGNDA